MSYIKMLLLVFFISFNVFSQSQETKNIDNEEQYFKSFIKFGFGKLDKNINFGGGIFFPLSEKFMLGLRGNVNSEIDILKTPTENLFDINLSGRYIPVIWNNLVMIAGAGIGYASGVKRGDLISRPLLITEEYEKVSYNSVSAIAEAEIGYCLTKFLGISLSGYSVFTGEKNITSYQVSLFFYGLNN